MVSKTAEGIAPLDPSRIFFESVGTETSYRENPEMSSLPVRVASQEVIFFCDSCELGNM